MSTDSYYSGRRLFFWPVAVFEYRMPASGEVNGKTLIRSHFERAKLAVRYHMRRPGEQKSFGELKVPA